MTTITAPVAGTARHSRTGPVLALAAVETRRLLTHPALLAGLALSVASSVPSAGEGPNDAWSTLAGLLHVPLAGGTFLAANLVALRSRRHGTDELYSSAPVPAVHRTIAQLLAVAATAALSIVLVLAAATALGAWDGLPVPFVDGTRDVTPSAGQLAVGPAIVGAIGALGVALARWVPSRAVGPIGFVALYFLVVATSWWLEGAPQWFGLYVDPYEQVGWVDTGDGTGYPLVTSRLYAGELAWHAVYLVGLSGVVSGLALLRHGVSRVALVVIGAAAAVAVLAGVAQLP